LDSLTFRFGRALVAGTFGALKSLAVFALVLAIGMPLSRAALEWYARGSFELIPPAVAATGNEVPLKVADATPEEASAVRQAAAQMRYRVDPRALTFMVVDRVLTCPDCTGEYVPFLDLVRLDRKAVHSGGLTLQWTVAHEIGHYVDQRTMTDATRRRFMEMRGIPLDTPWVAPNEPWARRPTEDFAEVFAALSLPSAPHSPSTSWGRVRGEKRFEDLLADAGVTFGREVPASGPADVLRREVGFVKDISADPRIAWGLALLGAIYAGLGAWPPARRAWNSGPPPDAVYAYHAPRV
jgi:hypothetical protein